MRRFFVLCTALSLLTAFTAGCEQKTKTQQKETVTTPGGTTTMTDTHTVESSGDNPPASSGGEKVENK